MSEKYPTIGEYSSSFLRERDMGSRFCNLPTAIEGYDKTRIKKYLKNSQANYRVVVNAIHAQDLPFEDQIGYLQQLKDELEDMGFIGVLELHPADTTTNSYHFHWWGNHPAQVHQHMVRFVVLEGLADESNAKIKNWETNDPIPDEYLISTNEDNTLITNSYIEDEDEVEDEIVEQINIYSKRNFQKKLDEESKKISELFDELMKVTTSNDELNSTISVGVEHKKFSFKEYNQIKYQRS